MDFGLVTRHCAELPNLARLAARGTLAPLRSVFPADSIPSWITIYTGRPPDVPVAPCFGTAPATIKLSFLGAAITLAEMRAERPDFEAIAFAEATRRAVRAWGLEILCVNPNEYSSALTAVLMPEGHNADAFRRIVLERFDMSLGQGLGKVSGKIFRIGHLGYFNDLMLCGTLAGVEMGLALAGVPHRKGGVDAAMAYLADKPAAEIARAA